MEILTRNVSQTTTTDQKRSPILSRGDDMELVKCSDEVGFKKRDSERCVENAMVSGGSEARMGVGGPFNRNCKVDLKTTGSVFDGGVCHHYWKFKGAEGCFQN